MIDKAKKLARYTEGLASGPDWGVDDQDTLEWLILQAEENAKKGKDEHVPMDDFKNIGKCLSKAEDLLHELLGSGCLDMDRDKMVRRYFGVTT